MKGTRAPRTTGNERGMALMYVIVMTQALAVITIGIMLAIAADSSGINQLQAVKAYAVAEGGLHYALARLQVGGASSYTGESVGLTYGGTTLGTANISVSCLEGALTPPNCVGPYAAYRRIRSDGQLQVSGPFRTLYATVQGSGGGSGLASCAGNQLTLAASSTVFGDIGSNNTINLQGTGVSASQVRANPPLPYVNDGSYTGSARATSTITCASGSCAPHVQGTTTPNVGSPVCPSASLPTFSPGVTNLTVGGGTTVTLDTTQRYNSITLNAGVSGGGFGLGSSCTSFTTLIIPTGAAGTTTVVEANTIFFNSCSRLVISGAGNVELRLATATGQALEAAIHSRIGVLPTDTPAVPAPVPAGRLKIITPSTNGAASTGSSALDFDGVAVVSAMLVAPNGGIVYEPSGASSSKWYGGLSARHIHLGTGVTHTYDPSIAIPLWGPPTSFGTLRGWKDQ